MKENIYTQTELENVYHVVSEKLKNMEYLAGHYNAKVLTADARINGLQETMRTMVNQYHEMDSIIRDFEIVLAVLGDEEREQFSFLDIDRMKEEQRVRLESIQVLIDVPIPGMPDVKLMKPKEVMECSS